MRFKMSDWWTAVHHRQNLGQRVWCATHSTQRRPAASNLKLRKALPPRLDDAAVVNAHVFLRGSGSARAQEFSTANFAEKKPKSRSARGTNPRGPHT